MLRRSSTQTNASRAPGIIADHIGRHRSARLRSWIAVVSTSALMVESRLFPIRGDRCTLLPTPATAALSRPRLGSVKRSTRVPAPQRTTEPHPTAKQRSSTPPTGCSWPVRSGSAREAQVPGGGEHRRSRSLSGVSWNPFPQREITAKNFQTGPYFISAHGSVSSWLREVSGEVPACSATDLGPLPFYGGLEPSRARRRVARCSASRPWRCSPTASTSWRGPRAHHGRGWLSSSKTADPPWTCHPGRLLGRLVNQKSQTPPMTRCGPVCLVHHLLASSTAPAIAGSYSQTVVRVRAVRAPRGTEPRVRPSEPRSRGSGIHPGRSRQ